ncbi:MAG: caspase family protein [Phaeodactylibacter sp.]|nr:caspase family protein [Phaeodactylibacter sp.]
MDANFIAIDEYAHCPKLNNCVKDAREFIEVLTARYQFEPENTITLFNAEATRPQILAGLKKLKSQVGPQDNLMIYFSGHGETEDNVGYWPPATAASGRSTARRGTTAPLRPPCCAS